MSRVKKQFLLGIFLSCVLLLVSFSIIRAQEPRIIILWPNPEKEKPNLQLQTFPFITIAPYTASTPASLDPSSPGSRQGVNYMGGLNGGLPENICPLDDIKPAGSSCTCIDSNAIACPAPVNGPSADCPSGTFAFRLPPGLNAKWYCVEMRGPGLYEPAPVPPAGCYAACIAKPVVYLYPEKPTLVSVRVEAPGKVFVSDPLYPEGGWKDVMANPDGTLIYQGKKFDELFYETSVTKKIDMPEEGIVIPIGELEITLRESITKLGLIGREREEFLEYWVPTLKNLNSPYIFFSILSPRVKESVDKLVITPAPTTRIEFIAYFKPLREPIEVKPLILPLNPPERIGFTEVEWGGTIIR